ncbi:MAG: 4Fe-4S binding protein [Phycisphaerales bacterium]
MSDDLSRRDLLRGRLFGGLARAASQRLEAAADALRPPARPADRAAPAAPDARRVTLPIHRPPGAVPEAAFLAGCTRCSACITACPVGAIVHAPARFRHAAGTPMIDPYASACIMCEDTPCISACEPGVLRAGRPLKMGVAWIQTEACLAHTGSFCTVCSERCPVPGAIEVAAGKPAIRPEVCTGCGVCASVCPAPHNAVVVMPLADRPAEPPPASPPSPPPAAA